MAGLINPVEPDIHWVVSSPEYETGETRVEKNTDEKREAKKREWHWDPHNHQ